MLGFSHSFIEHRNVHPSQWLLSSSVLEMFDGLTAIMLEQLAYIASLRRQRRTCTSVDVMLNQVKTTHRAHQCSIHQNHVH